MADLRSIFNKPVVMSYQVKNPEQQTPFWQTGAFTSDARIRSLLQTGLKEFSVPWINGLDTKLEPNYGNTIYTDIAKPRGINGGSSKGRAAYLNEAFLESSLETYLMGQSPLKLMAGMIDGYWTAQAENRALATLFGIYNFAQKNATAKADLILDISKTSGATEANGWDVDAYIDAEAMLPAAMRGRGAMVVNSKIRAKMRKQQLLEFVTTSDNLPEIEVYNGRAIVEDDENTVIGSGANARYITYLMGKGAFIADSVVGNDDLELDRTAATGNGSGHTALWTRRNMLIHPQGFSFVATDDQLTGGTKNEALSASWTDLQNPDFWQLAGKAKDTATRFLITNL